LSSTPIFAAHTGIIIAEDEAYDETDMTSHCNLAAAAQRRNRSAAMLLPQERCGQLGVAKHAG